MSRYIVGRSPEADVQITGDNSVSNQHLSISLVNGSWYVEDLNSTNGTYLEQRIGKKKIGQQQVVLTDYLFLGNYKVSVADIVKMLRLEQSSGAGMQSSSKEQKQKPEFSRYLKAEDGRFVRKNK